MKPETSPLSEPGTRNPELGTGFSFSPEIPGSKLYFHFFFFVLLSVALYANTFHNGFVFDDYDLILRSPYIRSFDEFPKLFGIGMHKYIYRPLRTISYAIDYAIGGLNPLPYHVSNTIYHGITVFLVFLVCRKLSGKDSVGLIAGLLFAAHPIQTDSVAYLSGRRDVLVALFYLWAFYAYMTFRETGRWRHLTVTFFAFVMSMLTKEMAASFPITILGYDLFRHLRNDRNGWRAAIAKSWAESRLLYVALIGGGAAYAVYVVSHGARRMTGWYGGSILTNFLTVAKVQVYDLYLLLLPLKLKPDYKSFPITTSPLEPPALLAALFLVFLLVLIAWGLKRGALPAFCGLWFFVTLLPVSHIIPHHELMAEHYLYLPSVGFVLLVAWGAEAAARRIPRQSAVVAVAVAVLLTGYGVRTVLRNRDWKDDYTLWSRAVADDPNSRRAHANLGSALLNRGEYERGRKEFEEAIRIDPASPSGWIGIGRADQLMGHLDLAEKELRKGTEMTTRYDVRLYLGEVLRAQGKLAEARDVLEDVARRNPVDVAPRIELAGIAMIQGREAEGLRMADEVLRVDPENPDALYLLGINELNHKRWIEARDTFVRLVKRRPDSAIGYYHLGLAESGLNRTEEARKAFAKAIALKPDYVAAHGEMGNLLRRTGDDEEALLHYKEAIRLDPRSLPSYANLGEIYARMNRWSDAEAIYRK
ncbi:MAG TPA: tetratricopeptide repeat protein, partial [Nitrospiria bacterium]|nr:tetratricopeptide repeat protein [Nitrospiria bacterium]